MKLAERTIEALGQIITGDKGLSVYRSGPNLVSFFNKLGFNEVYESGFPSRWAFAERCLREINNKPIMQKAITEALDPRDFIGTEYDHSTAIEYISQWLRYDGYEIFVKNGFIKIRQIGGGMIVVENDELNLKDDGHAFIDEQIKKSEEKMLDGDYDGAITNARSLVEGVLVYIDQQHEQQSLEYDGNLMNLYDRVRKKLNLLPSNPALDNSLKQVLTGLVSVVNGMSSISNKMGDRHARTYKPEKHHAMLMVNSARTFINFIFDTSKYQSK